MLVAQPADHAYSLHSYQNEELKSLSRYRVDKVQQRSKLKQSLSRLVTILFPELESAVSTIGDFHRFSSPDKILAFAGLSPSTYQSGKFTSQNAVMKKRGSRYLRCALFIGAHLISRYSKTFADYLDKKRAEGKHYFVAKKLVRVIFHLQRTGESFADCS